QDRGRNEYRPPASTYSAPSYSAPVLSGSDLISTWKRSTRSEKLSLCEALKKFAKDGSNISALDIHNCIEEATRGLDQTNSMTIADVAAACVVLMENM
ncbi:MAG TPA: hypothetical protein VIS27_04690, partial [Yeosuana sp.]